MIDVHYWPTPNGWKVTITLKTKRKALERVGLPSTAGKLPRWRRDCSVLEWFDSL